MLSGTLLVYAPSKISLSSLRLETECLKFIILNLDFV